MAVVATQLKAEITVEGAEQAKRSLQEVGKKADETKSLFDKLKDGFIKGIAFQASALPTEALGALKDQLVDIVKVAMDHQQIQTQTAQALRSTRDASGETADSIQALAEKYAGLTQFSADSTQQMENLLLTFTNIGKPVFAQTTQSVLDVSQAMHEDLQSAAIQVGKALGEPLTGMTALQRIGVTFSDTEKEQIKTMMAHNDIIGAQKIILHELNTEFGGSAEAAGKTAAGGMAILNNKLEEMKEKIGTALLPMLVNLEQWFIQQGLPLLQQFGNWIITQGIPYLHNLWNEFNTNVLPVLQQLGMWLMQNGLPLMQQFGGIIQNDVLPVLGTLITDGTALVKWLTAGGPQTTILKEALFVLGGVIAGIKIRNFIGDLMDMGKQAMDFATNIGPKLIQVLTGQSGISGAASDAEKQVKALGDTSKETAGAEDLQALSSEAKTATTEVKALGDASEVTGGEEALGGLGGAAKSAGTGIAAMAGDMAGALPIMGAMLILGQQLRDLFGGIKGPGGLTQDQSGAALNKTTGMTFGPFGGNSPSTGAAQNLWNTFLSWMSHGELGHAAGISNNPVGHWAMVGEQGPEAMYVPPGATILPNGMMPTAGTGTGGASPQPVYLQVDGYTFATLLMPHVTQAIRNQVGVYF